LIKKEANMKINKKRTGKGRKFITEILAAGALLFGVGSMGKSEADIILKVDKIERFNGWPEQTPTRGRDLFITVTADSSSDTNYVRGIEWEMDVPETGVILSQAVKPEFYNGDFFNKRMSTNIVSFTGNKRFVASSLAGVEPRKGTVGYYAVRVSDNAPLEETLHFGVKNTKVYDRNWNLMPSKEKGLNAYVVPIESSRDTTRRYIGLRVDEGKGTVYVAPTPGKIRLETSFDLKQWSPMATNILCGSDCGYKPVLLEFPASQEKQFFRTLPIPE
jgi:hypothetical protein